MCVVRNFTSSEPRSHSFVARALSTTPHPPLLSVSSDTSIVHGQGERDRAKQGRGTRSAARLAGEDVMSVPGSQVGCK